MPTTISRQQLRIIATDIQRFSSPRSPFVSVQEDHAYALLLLHFTENEEHAQIAQGLFIFGIEQPFQGLISNAKRSSIYPTSFKDDQRLTDLLAFHHYLKTSHDPLNIPNLVWRKETLIDMTSKALKKITSRDYRISTLQLGENTLDRLHAHIRDLPSTYHPSNKDSETLVKFTQFINAHSSNSCLVSDRKLELDICLGLLIFVPMYITKKNYWFLSPEGDAIRKGSTLYQLCLSFFKVKNHLNITLYSRLSLLKDLSELIKKIENNNGSMLASLVYQRCNALDVYRLRDELQTMIWDLELQEKNKPIDAATHEEKSSTSYIGSAWSRLQNTVVLVSDTTSGFFTKPLILTINIYKNPVNDRLYDMEVSFESDLSRTMMHLYSVLLDKLPRADEQRVDRTLKINISDQRQGYSTLCALISIESQTYFNQWVNTLLQSSFVSNDEKLRIGQVLGLGPTEELSLVVYEQEQYGQEGNASTLAQQCV